MSRSFKSMIVATCAVGLTLAGTGPASAAARVRRTFQASARDRRFSLIVEPGQIGPIYSVLTSARHSLDMTMYELAVDPAAEADLVADAATVQTWRSLTGTGSRRRTRPPTTS